jgi:hypothetical protein
VVFAEGALLEARHVGHNQMVFFTEPERRQSERMAAVGKAMEPNERFTIGITPLEVERFEACGSTRIRNS